MPGCGRPKMRHDKRKAGSADWRCDCIRDVRLLDKGICRDNDLFIFLAGISLFASTDGTLLSEEERERERRLLRQEDRMRFRIAHHLKRQVCSFFTGSPPESLGFTIDSQNKPYLTGSEHCLAFNLSHSGNWVGVAVSRNSPVGFDVQAPIDLAAFPVSEIAHPSDCIQPDTPKKATLIWSIKEAAAKAHGIGLRYPLNNLRIDATINRSWSTVNLLDDSWFIRSGVLSDGSAMAVAARTLCPVYCFQLVGEK